MEIIVKSLNNKNILKQAEFIVIGDAKILERAAKQMKINSVIHKIESVYEIKSMHDGINCYDLDLLPEDHPIGEVSSKSGNAAFQYLKTAINLANEGKIDAICTAPLNKEALHKGGHIYPGHTEILAELTGTKDFSMMLSSPKLKVIHVTTHVGLIDAINLINPERVYKVIKLAHTTLEKSGIPNPKIGVCGINPHAGENGLFGNGEEEEKIVPAIMKTKEEGINVEGPLPADTLFFRAQQGDFDIVVAMYHDQGHGPIKVLGLESGVNITVGFHQ